MAGTDAKPPNPNRKYKVVTHSGFAHRDDFISCCLLLSRHKISKIVRSSPNEEELQSDRCFVVDVGGQYDPMKLNFDHHQFEHDTDCALSLLLRHFEVYDVALALFPWLALTEYQDNHGVYETAKHYGIDPDVFTKCRSPVEMQMLRQFSDIDILYPNSYFAHQMRKLGDAWFKVLKSFEESRAALEQIDFKSNLMQGGKHYWLDLRKLPPSINMTAVREARTQFDKYSDKQIAGSISVDTRRRNKDHVVVLHPEYRGYYDFAIVVNEPEVVYAHKTGFLMVIKNECQNVDIQRLIYKAMTIGSS